LKYERRDKRKEAKRLKMGRMQKKKTMIARKEIKKAIKI